MTQIVEPAHSCALPVSDEELWERTAAFLGEGLRAGEHVVYGENRTADAVLERLVDDGVPVEGPLASGQLVILPTEVMVAMADAPASAVLESVTTMIDGALAQGYPAVRLLSEASTGMSRGDGAAMLEYEARFDEVLRGRPARIHCLYDRNRYSEPDIARLRAAHRHEIPVAAPLYDDNLLRITTPRPYVARIAGEVDHSNRPMIRRALEAALDEVLRSPSSPPEVELDLSSLRFLDVAGAVSLVHAAAEFPCTHTLLLTGVRPGVMRVLDRCGAPFAPRLRVTAHPGPAGRPVRPEGGGAAEAGPADGAAPTGHVAEGDRAPDSPAGDDAAAARPADAGPGHGAVVA